jgi:hypothetical protein
MALTLKTLRRHESDRRDFEAWYQVKGRGSLPAETAPVSLYFVDRSEHQFRLEQAVLATNPQCVLCSTTRPTVIQWSYARRNCDPLASKPDPSYANHCRKVG